MKKALALILALVMALSLIACGAKPDPAPGNDPTAGKTDSQMGGDLKVAVSAVSNTLDPHFSGGTQNNYLWMEHIYETPLAMGSDGVVYPLICDYVLDDDAKTLSLTVKDRRFSNGEKITIEDVMASLDRCAAQGGSVATKFMDHVTDVKVEGSTVVYTMDVINPTMMQELGDIRGAGYIMPKSICEKYGPETQIDKAEDVIGSGPYVLTTYEPDSQIVVSRNENYDVVESSAPGAAAPRMAYCDTISFLVNTDSASRTAGMIAGDYDIGGILTEMQDYADQIGLKRNLLHNQWTHAIFFNLSENNADSPVQDVNFRKAVRAALDMDAIMMSVFNGDAERYELEPSAMPSDNTNYYNTILKDNPDWLKTNVEKAKEYLAASNYNGEEITWLVSEGSAFYRAAVIAVPMLEEIGIKVNLWTVDSGSHGGLRADPTTDFDIGAWETQKGISNPYEQGSLVTGAANGWYTNDKKTELLEILASTPTGSAESVQAYTDLCHLYDEEVPYIAFGTGLTSTYTGANVELNIGGVWTYYWNTYFAE